MKFKICGLFNNENISQVAELNPDYIGHIFWEKSVRYVKSITPILNKEIKKTGVFFNSDTENIINKINEHNLACVQLHGDESPKFCRKILDNPNSYEIVSASSIAKEARLAHELPQMITVMN